MTTSPSYHRVSPKRIEHLFLSKMSSLVWNLNLLVTYLRGAVILPLVPYIPSWVPVINMWRVLSADADQCLLLLFAFGSFLVFLLPMVLQVGLLSEKPGQPILSCDFCEGFPAGSVFPWGSAPSLFISWASFPCLCRLSHGNGFWVMLLAHLHP